MKRPSLESLALTGLSATAFGVALTMARTKLTASMLGPEGVGAFALLQQVPATLLVPLGVVTGPALVAALARSGGDDRREAAVLDSAVTLVVLGGGLLSFAGVLVAPRLAEGAPGGVREAATWLFAGAMLSALASIPSQRLLALGRVSAHARVSVLAGLVGTGVVMGATAWLGLRGLVIGTAVSPVAALGVSWRTGRLPRGWRPRWRVEAGFVREAFVTGGATLVAGLAAQGTQLVVRHLLSSSGGLEEGGRFQAAWAVGAVYFGVVLQALGNVVFPRYAVARDVGELSEAVEESSAFVMRWAPGLVLVAFALRAPAMRLLYADGFGPAATAAGVLMAGDLLKALSWALAGPLLYRGHVRVFVALELCGAVAMSLPALFLVPRFGTAGAAAGITLGYALYLVAAAVALRGACGVVAPPRRLVAALLFSVALLGAVWADARWAVVDALVGVAGAVLLWRAGAWSLLSRRLGLGPAVAQ